MTYSGITTSSTGWGGLTLQVDATGHRFVQPDYPVLARPGPAFATSCTDLAVLPQVCFDVNGYYRELGVHWRSKIGAIRKAYQRLDGPNDARLTYIFKQLLNKQTRLDYDCTPLGALFIDEYVMAALKRKMMAQRAARGESIDTPTAFVDELRRNGFDAQPEPTDTPGEGVDEPVETVDDGDRTAREFKAPWTYAYYRLKSRMADTDRLAQWQELLVQALREKGTTAQFAVGYHRLMARTWLAYPAGDRVIFFLEDHEEPTIETARQAVSDRVVAQQFPNLTRR